MPALATRQPARIDPVLLLVALVVMGVIAWAALPLADGVSASKDTRVQVTVDNAITIAPPPPTSPLPTTGNGASVRLPDLIAAGQTADVTSNGWTLGSNWDAGYEVFIRATSNPALRGQAAVDGDGSRDSFQNFTAGACPCRWTTTGFTKGVFGYSASVGASAGSPTDTAQWGTSSNRKYRGLTTQDYRLYASGGRGTFDLSLLFRSQIPPGLTQAAGSYRATATLSVSAAT